MDKNVLMLIGILVLIIIVITIEVKAINEAANNKERDKIGIYIRIMTNYFQIITLVNSF